MISAWQNSGSSGRIVVMEVLSFPFRFESNGRAAKVQQRSDAHYAQQISQYIQTRPGELSLSPFYGVEDMAFRSIHPSEINVGLGLYHPEVGVQDVRVYYSAEGVQAIDVHFVPEVNSASVAEVTETGGMIFNA
jgi:hypothetical protein